MKGAYIHNDSKPLSRHQRNPTISCKQAALSVLEHIPSHSCQFRFVLAEMVKQFWFRHGYEPNNPLKNILPRFWTISTEIWILFFYFSFSSPLLPLFFFFSLCAFTFCFFFLLFCFLLHFLCIYFLCFFLLCFVSFFIFFLFYIAPLPPSPCRYDFSSQ